MNKSLNLNIARFPKELQLVIACLRFVSDEEKLKHISSLTKGSVDWDAFLTWVDRHRVAPLVYHNLRNLRNLRKNSPDPPLIPDEIMHNLRTRYEVNARHALALAAELARLAKLFDEEGIPLIALKGPALALQVYGDLGLRHAGDLDVLTHPQFVSQAEKLLLRKGYKRIGPDFELTQKQYKAFLRQRQHFRYASPRGNIVIELHWRWFNNPRLLTLSFNEVWKERQTIQLAGFPVHRLSMHHDLFYLSVHGAKHNWILLFWLADVAALINNNDDIGLGGMNITASKLGIQHLLEEGICLANMHFACPLSELYVDHSKENRPLREMVALACNLIKDPAAESPQPFTPAYIMKIRHGLKLRRELNYKISYWISLVGPPEEDWGIAPMPDSLFPLYYIVRPIIWFFRRYTQALPKHHLYL